jgi:pimeloyl-ACP methyl ester carboxylesterase
MTRSLEMQSDAPAAQISLPPLTRLRAAQREVLAYVVQAGLIARDLGPTRPLYVPSGGDLVVFIHGWLATAGVLRPLRRRVEQELGVQTASFTYAPNLSVERVAERLRDFVGSIDQGVRVHLVGHSVGGLVARWYVQQLGGAARVTQTISIGSPFQGTRHARRLPGPVCRALMPASVLLSELKASAHAGVPHLSIAAAKDPIVTELALFHLGEWLVVDDAGHNSLLYHPRVVRAVVRRLSQSY